MAAKRIAAYSWADLASACKIALPSATVLANGPTTSQARLRLFGLKDVSKVRVTLYRDHHAWCPYCQKVWLWLEEKRVPYQISKVTMFCYGEKESWYKRKVTRSGMLPAVSIDGRVITESDVILGELEKTFGVLGRSIADPEVVKLRRLERALFSAWCQWLCYPSSCEAEEKANQASFEQVAAVVDSSLSRTAGGFFLSEFSCCDTIFVPYVERMNASLFYFKGFRLRDPKKYPGISRWFDSLETRPTYLGTQSDFHTHSHDLPPQMGGCYPNNTSLQRQCAKIVDEGPDWSKLPDAGFSEPVDAAHFALARVLKHRASIIEVNPAPASVTDLALRCALTRLITGTSTVPPPRGADAALRYVRDRVNVPRDMPIWSARHLRAALEATAAEVGSAQGTPLLMRHRRDQDPRPFGRGDTGEFDSQLAADALRAKA